MTDIFANVSDAAQDALREAHRYCMPKVFANLAIWDSQQCIC